MHNRGKCLACRNQEKFFQFINQLRAKGGQIISAGISVQVWNPETEQFEVECLRQQDYDIVTTKVCLN